MTPCRRSSVAEETGLVNGVGGRMGGRACAWMLRFGPTTSASRSTVACAPWSQSAAVVMDALKHLGLPRWSGSRSRLPDRAAGVRHRARHCHALRLLGLRISMDDFGTGFSSLERYLRSLFDKIKIDQIAVRDLAANRDA